MQKQERQKEIMKNQHEGVKERKEQLNSVKNRVEDES
jgi:hypothetical protein